MTPSLDRRQLIGTGLSAAMASPLLAAPRSFLKADSCIFLWLGGGMGQMDTFDPKAVGDSSRPGKPGSLYGSIPTCVPGVRVCEHLPQMARLMDRATAVRTVNHKVVDEHAFATNLVHTGRMIGGNVTYPSIGSLVAHTRGAGTSDVPAYMLIGYPNVSRGPGFLGARASYVYLTDTETGPSGFSRPAAVDASRAHAREVLLKGLVGDSPSGTSLASYRQAQEQALRLSGPAFLRHFDLKTESAEVRSSYGGEFGQRCLLARRLAESGVRFIEVSHNLNFLNGTGWDVHNEGIRNQHLLIRELDTALSALLIDLEQRGMLDSTLVVVATEFGRPPEFDGRGGRGHQGSAFTMVLAGGGLRHRGVYGVTDDSGKKIIEGPVSIPDFHATILAAMGVDPALELMDGTRPVPVTDGGKPVVALMG